VLNRVSPVWRWLLFIPVGYGVAVFASTRLAALLDTSPAAGSARLRVGVFFVLLTLFIGWTLLRGAAGDYWTARSWAALGGAIVGAATPVVVSRNRRSRSLTPVVGG